MANVSLDFYSPFKDNPAGEPSSTPDGDNSFGDLTFSTGADGTKTPVAVEEVQFAGFGEDSSGGMDVFSPAPSAVGKAPGSGS